MQAPVPSGPRSQELRPTRSHTMLLHPTLPSHARLGTPDIQAPRYPEVLRPRGPASRGRVCAEQRGGSRGGQSLPLAAPEARNFENFGRNSRYLRIPGNRLCPRAKRGRPASAATPKAQITDFAEVSPGFYYRPQRIMDSVPFCGVPKSR